MEVIKENDLNPNISKGAYEFALSKKNLSEISLQFLIEQSLKSMLISRYFGIGSVTSHFLLLKFSLLESSRKVFKICQNMPK